MSTPTYRKAVRDRWIGLATLFAITAAMGYMLNPVNTAPKIAVLAVLLVAAGVTTSIALRKQMRSCVCDSCGAELFSLIDTARAQRMSLRYCPFCGSKVTNASEEAAA